VTRNLFAFALVCLASGPVHGQTGARELAYGPHPRHRLDLSVPVGKGFPTVLFVHGGSLTSGDKSDDDYRDVCAPFAPAGIACASMNYRLAPGDPWPAQAEDVASAIVFLRQEIESRGGDARRLFLAGHSSGAMLAALIGADARYLAAHRLGTDVLRGVIPIGSIMWDDDLRSAIAKVGRARVEQAFAKDPDSQMYGSLDAYEAHWPIEHVRAGLPPFLFLMAESETEQPPILKTNRAFVEAARKLGNDAEYRVFAGRNHYSMIRAWGGAGDPVFAAVREFVSRPSVPAIAVARLPQNPLITVKSSPSLGTNVNGPTVIRVPDWVQRPLGRYYMYFANHMGDRIFLAYADAIAGPWTIHEPGVLHVRDTAMFRPQPDPPEALADFYTHVASPEIAIDHDRRRFVMWFHGWWTNGERWPRAPAEARAWTQKNGYSQFTQSAESADGLRFEVRPAITRTSYLRVFRHGGQFYGMSRLGRLSRAADPFASFELGPNPFRDGPYAGRIRHLALVPRGNHLHVFFTAIGDAPERVMRSTIDLTGDWTTWRGSPPIEVLRPAEPYECANLPDAPSLAGDIAVPVRQIRDPFVFEDAGKAFLFYSICGEQGIAAAELSPIPDP
jgi:acetyl esterase/lipase